MEKRLRIDEGNAEYTEEELRCIDEILKDFVPDTTPKEPSKIELILNQLDETYKKIHITNNFYEKYELSQQLQIGYAIIEKEIEDMHNNFEKNIERIRLEW